MARSKTSKERELPTYTNARELLVDQAENVFRRLEEHSFIEVAYEFGLDRFFGSTSTMRNYVYQIYNDILDDPKKFNIDLDLVKRIQEAVQARSWVRKDNEALTEREKNEALSNDNASLMLYNRDISAKILRKKLDKLDKSKKDLEKEPIKNIAWVVGLLFDKGQIVQGQATEHIAVLSKIGDNMSSEDAMEAVIKMREKNLGDKDTK